MKLIKRIGFFILFIIVPWFIINTLIKGQIQKENIEIIMWDNLYTGNNINLSYTEDDKRIERLDETYNINNLCKDLTKEQDKALRAIDMVNSIVQFDDVNERGYFNGYDILKNKGDSKKVSNKDMAIITRDFLTAMGFAARVGEFRNGNTLFSKDISYCVVEYWSIDYNKWIMLDILDKGYFKDAKGPCSAVEIISKRRENLEYIGNKSKKEYLRNKSKVFTTYSIAIDNTLDMKVSNTFIRFIKNKEDISLEHNNKILPPTIFTNKEELFKKSPKDKNKTEDSGLNIVLMKKSSDKNELIIGAFSNGAIKDSYYVRINNEDFHYVNKYMDFTPKVGENTIEVSVDGKTPLATIKLKNNKKIAKAT